MNDRRALRTKLKRPVAKCIGSILSRCRKLRSSERGTCGTRIYPCLYVCACSCSSFRALTVSAKTRDIETLARASSFGLRLMLYMPVPCNLLEHRARRWGWWYRVESPPSFAAKRQITRAILIGNELKLPDHALERDAIVVGLTR